MSGSLEAAKCKQIKRRDRETEMRLFFESETQNVSHSTNSFQLQKILMEMSNRF